MNLIFGKERLRTPDISYSQQRRKSNLYAVSQTEYAAATADSQYSMNFTHTAGISIPLTPPRQSAEFHQQQ